MCNLNQSTPLLIYIRSMQIDPMQTCILSSCHLSPCHRERETPLAATNLFAMHLMFALQANYPPTILNCSQIVIVNCLALIHQSQTYHQRAALRPNPISLHLTSSLPRTSTKNTTIKNPISRHVLHHDRTCQD